MAQTWENLEYPMNTGKENNSLHPSNSNYCRETGYSHPDATTYENLHDGLHKQTVGSRNVLHDGITIDSRADNSQFPDGDPTLPMDQASSEDKEGHVNVRFYDLQKGEALQDGHKK